MPLESRVNIGYCQLMFPIAVLWSFTAALVGTLAGLASALFLFLLNWATETREAHGWIILCLPLAGLLTGFVYHTIGKSVESGNNLLMDEIHEPKAPIPFQMAPVILLATIVTHLFGGSAGREGTAVQMSGALADHVSAVLSRWPSAIPGASFFRDARHRRILLMAGLSAGFGSIFGTPMAGAIFGLEVLSIGRMDYEAILPCFVASVIGDLVTKACGIHHDIYVLRDLKMFAMSPTTLVYAVIAGALFGLVGMIFYRSSHWVEHLSKEKIKYPPLRPFVGGIIVAAMVFGFGTTRYIGLGVPTIAEAFDHARPWWDFAAKLVFTVLTLNTGFKGGEVTPLFFIGATLGNALAYIIPLPLSLLSAMGFVAVFAGAANVPVACSLMAFEIFGPQVGAFASVACVASYVFSGNGSIYHSQRALNPKNGLRASA